MVTSQAYLFFIFIINGILIGLLFDFFRIARKVFHTSDIITYIEDVLFWILAGSIVLYSIFIFNNGQLRLFMFLGILLGAIIYMLFVSSYVIKINVTIIKFIKKVLGILLTPFQLVYQFFKKTLIKPVHFLFINLRKSFANFAKKLHNPFKNFKKAKKL